LARASQVAKHWHDILNDDLTWKNLCKRHSYRRLSLGFNPHAAPTYASVLANGPRTPQLTEQDSEQEAFSGANKYMLDPAPRPTGKQLGQQRNVSYKTHFKERYMVETAWRSGGRQTARHIQPDQGVVTSLHLTPTHIVVAQDNAKIHVYNPEGELQRTLVGHVMGVWAMVPWGETLVSGGCDRDVRVWNMATGDCRYILRGHTSTVRCLKMSDSRTAISGSRDTTLRVWDIETGVCKSILVGHQASVRCLEIHGDYVVSGSYDTTAKIWSISQGTCLRTLSGHFSQIYAIAFDGVNIATGSLDTSVRIWDPATG
jgi:F-box and WD-40 domain protein CDC4